MTALSMNKRCVWKSTPGTKKILPFNTSGKNSEMSKNGDRIRHENNIETKITGITAFFSNETFLNTSYDPNKRAEIKARNNHIFYFLLIHLLFTIF